jgi:hypothetical protein
MLGKISYFLTVMVMVVKMAIMAVEGQTVDGVNLQEPHI